MTNNSILFNNYTTFEIYYRIRDKNKEKQRETNSMKPEATLCFIFSHFWTDYFAIDNSDWYFCFCIFSKNMRNRRLRINQWPQHSSTQFNISFHDVCGLRSNSYNVESLLLKCTSYIYEVCEIILDYSVVTNAFSFTDYIPIWQENSTMHTHGFVISTRENKWIDVTVFLC